MDKAIECITKWCHHCASPLNYPHTAVEQSTTAPPDAVGMSFAADVIKRNRQLILVVREYVTSSKTTTLLEDERHQSLRGALVKLCIESRPLDVPQAVIRTDPVPWFKALPNDVLLRSRRLSIHIGRVKNNNKNPVAERAVQKPEHELLWQDPFGRMRLPVTPFNSHCQLERQNAQSSPFFQGDVVTAAPVFPLTTSF